MQEYTDDTANLRRALDGLGGMAALTDPDMQLKALPELEQYVSAVCSSRCFARHSQSLHVEQAACDDTLSQPDCMIAC